MHKKSFSWLGLLVVAVLLIGVNLLSYSTLRGAKADLTENKLYTLTEGTHNVLADVEEPVTLKLFYSRKLINVAAPQLSGYAMRVQELLEEYRDSSGGDVRVEIIEPEPFSEEEDEAALAGLQSVPVGGTESLFFGLVGTNSVDDQEVIAFLDPRKESTLEYDLTRIVYNLSNPQKQVIGVISGLPIMGNQDMFAQLRQPNQVQQPYVIISQLRQMYEVRDLGKEVDAIPEDVSVLMVVHPKEMTDATKYAIDQYVLRGGHAVVFVDPHAEADEPPFDEANPYAGLWASRASTFDPLFGAWGIEMAPEMFVADAENAQKVSFQTARGTIEASTFLAYAMLNEEELSDDDVVTDGLVTINVGSAGALETTEGATTTVTPLLVSSAESVMMEVEKIKVSPQPNELMAEFESRPAEDKGQRVIAARISGVVKSAFPGGLVTDGESAESEHLDESQQPINVIVVADTDLLTDRFWVQVQNFLGSVMAMPFADNGSFAVNAVENLAGSNDLISVRSRGTSLREFDRLQDIAKAAEEKYRERETELQEKLQEIQTRINEIQAAREDSAVVLTQEQQQAIEEARQEFVDTRKELRAVQLELNRDIENLGKKVKFINIAAIPLLVGFYAAALGLFRMLRRRR